MLGYGGAGREGGREEIVYKSLRCERTEWGVGGVVRSVKWRVAGMWAAQKSVTIGTERETAQETQSIETHKAADLWAIEG